MAYRKGRLDKPDRFSCDPNRLNTVSIIWFASQLTQQVKQNTADIASMQADAKERDKVRTEMVAKCLVHKSGTARYPRDDVSGPEQAKPNHRAAVGTARDTDNNAGGQRLSGYAVSSSSNEEEGVRDPDRSKTSYLD